MRLNVLGNVCYLICGLRVLRRWFYSKNITETDRTGTFSVFFSFEILIK